MKNLELLDEIFPGIRREYQGAELLEQELTNQPIELFKKWMVIAYQSSNPEPNAFALSTVRDAKPRSRVLLLKAYYGDNFVFFSNYQSDKGLELKTNKYASMLFFWPEVMRQVRIEGSVELLDSQLSESYFQTRPQLAKVGAYASRQSQEVSSRNVIEQDFQNYQTQFAEQNIKCPNFWGGFEFSPNYYEFWQGRASRLHDRLIYKKDGLNWKTSRLSP